MLPQPIDTASATAKPLHVRLASSLGWKKLVGYCKCARPSASHDCERIWYGIPPWATAGEQPVPRYDLDWGATGTLIERLAISLDSRSAAGRRFWTSQSDLEPGCTVRGRSALESACLMILILAGTGRLGSPVGVPMPPFGAAPARKPRALKASRSS
jgi:hypothetical protein